MGTSLLIIIVIVVMVFLYMNLLNEKDKNNTHELDKKSAIKEHQIRLQNPEQEKRKNEIINKIISTHRNTKILELRNITSNYSGGGYKTWTTFNIQRNNGYLRNLMIEHHSSFEIILEIWKSDFKKKEDRVSFTVNDDIEGILKKYKHVSDNLLTYLD
jgi:hypothetical protein